MVKMKLPAVNQGTCSCGAVSVRTATPPMLVYNCHCSHCRRFAGADFGRTSMFWSFCVEVVGPVDSQATSGPPGIGLVRTRCRKCGQGVCDWGAKLVRPLAFPSHKVLNLEPTVNVFYGSGAKKGIMGLTTYHGDYVSFAMHSVPVLTQGIPQLIHLAWIWIKTAFFVRRADKKQMKND